MSRKRRALAACYPRRTAVRDTRMQDIRAAASRLLVAQDSMRGCGWTAEEILVVAIDWLVVPASMHVAQEDADVENNPFHRPQARRSLDAVPVDAE